MQTYSSTKNKEVMFCTIDYLCVLWSQLLKIHNTNGCWCYDAVIQTNTSNGVFRGGA